MSEILYMQIKRQSDDDPQGRLDLAEDGFFIDRDYALLAMYGVAPELKLNDRLSRLSFDRVTRAHLEIVPLMLDDGCSSVTGCDARNRLVNVKDETIFNPLCLWGLDLVFGYASQDRIREVLARRPNPDKRIIIFTEGVFTVGEGENNRRFICLREINTGFEVVTVSYSGSLILWSGPWDLVALCVPKDSCSSSLTG